MKKTIVVLLAVLTLFYSAPFVRAEDNTLYIRDAEDLAALTARVASGDSMDGVTVRLCDNITLSAPFLPIGADPWHPFSGVFDGGGYAISGLEVNGGDYCGLFGCVTDGTVKNLLLYGACINGGSCSALLVGRLYAYSKAASVENCTVSGKVNGYCYVGGLCGSAYAYSSGANSRIYIKGSRADAETEGDMYAGGICGKAEARATDGSACLYIENCTAFGSMKAKGDYGAIAGGIAGGVLAQSDGGRAVAYLADCVSYVCTEAEKTAAGGVCGALGASGGAALAVAEDSVAVGTTRAGALAGGICGKADGTSGGDVAVKQCIAAGNVFGGSVYSLNAGKAAEDSFRAVLAAQLPDGIKTEAFALGDVNGDGKINSLDAAFVLKYDAGLWICGLASGCAGDVNGDGKANSLDAALILRYDAFGGY